MPLTPEEVRNKEFTTVRLREGYDEEEVDAFLDEVEVELTRLYRENDDLRAQLEAAHRGGPVPLRAEADKPPMAMGGPGGGSDGATRILALAQRTADELVAEARAEADKTLGEVRAKIEAVEREARAKSEALQREARAKADSLERDAREKHREAMGSLENERVALERKVEDLRAFEREYRSRLKSYLENQLRELEGRVGDTPRPAQPAPSAHQARTGSPYGGPGAHAEAPPMAARGFLLEDEAEPHRG